MIATVTTTQEKHILQCLHPILVVFAGSLFVLGATASPATAQRTIEVEPGFGTLNEAIHGDTTATGERIDPNTVYVLQRGGHYALNGGIIVTGDFHLQVVAEEGTDRPPILQIFADETGASAADMFTVDGDLTLSNLYLLGVDDLGAFKNTFAVMNGDGRRLVVEDCVADYARFIVFRFNGLDGKIYVRDSFIRNVITTNNLGNGKFIDPRGNTMDTVYVENTTLSTVSAEILRESGAYQKYLFFNHNTLYNVHAFFRNDLRVHSSKLLEGRITNNLFINMAWPGDTLSVPDPSYDQLAGLFPFDSLNVPGVNETDRDIVISHNNFFTEQELLDFYPTTATLKPYPLFNPRGQSFVDAGLVVVEDNLEVDPQFVNVSGVTDHINWVNLYWYDPASITGPNYFYDPDGPQNVDTWPLPEDFSYPTSSPLYTAGTGGFPIGDLNWFPEKKAEWIAAGGGTGIIVATEGDDAVPEGFVLRGNYPNPFNPSTTLRFDLPAAAEVRVDVFDLLGRRVMALPVTRLQAGKEHAIHIDAAALGSGVYVYRIAAITSTTTYSESGRMVLLK